MTTTAEPTGTADIAVNTSTALRWRGLVAVVLFGGGGLALLVVSAFGLVGQHPIQRIGCIVLSVVLVAFGGFALRGALKPSVWVVVAADGLAVRGGPGDFRVTWAELTAVTLDRDRRSWGRSRYWFYRLRVTPRAADDFAEHHPELAARHARGRYVHDLGRIGRAARKLERGLRAHAPAVFAGVRTR